MAALLVVFVLAGACGKKKPEALPPTPAHSQARPKIFLPEREFDFGRVREGEAVSHVFEIQNRGTADLVVEAVQPACSCLATLVGAKTIAPGGTGRVEALLDTEGQQGKQRTGFSVDSNDPVQRRILVTLLGEVVPEVAVVPRFLLLKPVRVGEKVAMGFAVTVDEPERVRVAAVTVEDRRFTARRSSEGPGGGGEYELRFEGSRKPQRIATEVVVRCEGSSQTEIRVPAAVEVIGNLQYPKVVQVTRKQGEPFSYDVAITSRSGQPFRLKRAEDPNGFLELEIRQDRGPEARVRVRMEGEPEGVQIGKRYGFRVFTSDRIEPRVEIPYIIYPPWPASDATCTPPSGSSPSP